MISGIGKETALALSRLGAKVIIGSRNVDKSKKVAQEIQDETGSQVDLLKKLLIMQVKFGYINCPLRPKSGYLSSLIT